MSTISDKKCDVDFTCREGYDMTEGGENNINNKRKKTTLEEIFEFEVKKFVKDCLNQINVINNAEKYKEKFISGIALKLIQSRVFKNIENTIVFELNESNSEIIERSADMWKEENFRNDILDKINKLLYTYSYTDNHISLKYKSDGNFYTSPDNLSDPLATSYKYIILRCEICYPS